MLRFGDDRFVVHLMQGGRLDPDEKQSAKPKGGLARWTLRRRLARCCSPRWPRRSGPGCGSSPATRPTRRRSPVSGPTPLGISRDALAAALAGYKSMRVHGFLRDQRAIAGIGRRLSSEICWRAKLSPFASTHKLTADEIDRLHAAMHACIDEALAFERGLDAMSSSAERPGSVYKRAGEACPVCGDTIRAVEYNAYTVNYCPTCQTGGKVLADNTTSKFLK